MMKSTAVRRGLRRRIRRTVVTVALAVVAVGVSALAARAQEGTIRWQPHELRVGGEVVDTVEMGRLLVPERRDVATEATVDLAFVRLPSRSADPGAPIVYLDGGPGGSGIGLASVPAYHRLFEALRAESDVILLSQRGTGSSSPRLVCPLASPLPDDLFTTRERMLNALMPSVEQCAETWRTRGVDLAGYTTEESAADLESLRRALGAEQLSLLGFSYGTHLALAAMRRYPERIHRVALIGTEGLEHTLKLPSTGDQQLRHVAALVAADETAASATPDLYAAVDTLLSRLDREPLRLELSGEDGRRTILLGGDGMRYLFQRDLGDTNDLPLWPAAIRLTLDGELGLVTRLAERRFSEISGVPLMSMLMDCASGVGEERERRIEREAMDALLGTMTNSWFPDVCRLLPEAGLGQDYRARFVSPIPTLFLSGTLDANTPPYQAHYVSWGWPNATHLVVPQAGHETLLPFPAAQEVIVDFFEGENVSGREIDLPPVEFYGVQEVLRMLRR